MAERKRKKSRKQQIAALRKELVERQGLLQAKLQDLEVESCKGGSDLADCSSQESHVRSVIAERKKVQDEILRIKSALQRIDGAGYGICQDCEEEISLQRLEAVPTAIRCVECQKLHEDRVGVRRSHHAVSMA
ncbi:MAG: hypothetical protein A2Y67_01915 [Candidatus Buchananbacteria bacterium RBG_13_39_9]|uniref:Zinc finger DksA/TraR C4-type domain-containing protein n=1 Tax=Candidatus Buchananbacteria bacterium RBG_13_39_9 TaxID=1797531 RepID=A0A1G1XR92_9BACT|nr:MAG: hypothetical protein A2Y67_01915 [Candidatus Buchananbacteria bacterium RBG_13_39_9]